MENILQAHIIPTTAHALHRQCSGEEEMQMVGGYFDNGKFCWIAKDSVLTVLRHSTQTVVAHKNFSSCLTDDVLWTIVSCKAYSNFLLIGLASTDKKGAICLFNHHVCKVMKTIHIPYAVNCMEVILEEGGATTSSKPFAANLRWFFGIVAVGTLDGHLYLIDVRLDNNNFYKSATAATLEVVPTVVRDIPEVRDAVCLRGSHLAFDLLEQCHEDQEYHFVNPDDQIVKSYHLDDVAVTSLFFEKRCTSLFVGFSFGQFHIFDLKQLALSFSSQIGDFDGAVTDFVFQEPENDPKHFCYLWVVQCALDEALIESALRGTMYQLIFENKELLKENSSLKSLYTMLESCNRRFQVGFDESLGLGPSIGTSKILQCCAIERYHPFSRVSGEDDYASTPYSSILATAWVTTRDDKQTVNMLLFDINGWYVAHMPASCGGFADDETYVALWSLNSCVKEDDGDILAICTPPTLLRHFHTKIHPTPLQFTQPSSYSMQANCLTTKKLLTCKMAGVQEQVIEHLLTARCECLVNPTNVLQRLIIVGLMDLCGGDMLTVDQKREAILTSALNHDIFAFLAHVITDLASGEYVASGCTLRLVLEWAWKQTAVIKASIDNLCIPIFDCSAVTLDDTSQELLSRHITQLNNLHLVFKKLRHAATITQLSELELDVKDNVITLIQDYLKILRWFIGARLLPEQLDDHISFELETYEEFHFVYKQKELRKVYEERRSEIKEVNTSSESSLLLIDGLLDEAGSELLSQWKNIDGNDSTNYPPPSLYALLSMYYLESLDTSLKHTITTYFLLDVLAVYEALNDTMKNSTIYEATYNDHHNVVSFFPQTFQLSLALTKLIQAFWLLDHRQYQESCSVFCEAGTERVTSPWQHRRILQAYIQQGHTEYAQQYLVAQKPSTSSIDDVKLHIDVLVTNGKLHHALRTAQMKTDCRNKESIYSHLFATSYKHGELHNLLKLTVATGEELMVSKYLETSGIPHAHDILVLHHLRRARYVDAIQLYQKNKIPHIMTKHDELEKGYHATLNHLVKGYMLCLPDPIRDIALLTAQPVQRNVALRKEVSSVQPLSALVNSKKKSAPLSQAELLTLTMSKLKETPSSPPMTPFRRRPGAKTALEKSSELSRSKRFFSNDLQVSAPKSNRRSLTSVRGSFSRSSLGGVDESSPIFRRPLTSSVSTEEMNKKKSSLMESASVLLQTPPVQRNRKVQACGNNIELMTPQSILKVKMLKGESLSLSSVSAKTSSTRILSSQSTSLTSLKEDRLSGKLEFGDEGLDSSGSECETPAWMMSSMASQNKEKTPTKSYLSRFNIETPVVKHVQKLKSASSYPESEERSSSTKRLRFRDLIIGSDSSDDNLIEESTFIHLPPLDNVIVQDTDEKEEVDVIGDDVDDSMTQPRKRLKLEEDHELDILSKHHDPLLSETTSTVTRENLDDNEAAATTDEDPVIESSAADVINEDILPVPLIPDLSSIPETEILTIDEAAAVEEPQIESVKVEVPTPSLAPKPERFSLHSSTEMLDLASSDNGSMALRLSSSSDHFTDAESHVSDEKMSTDGETLEISSDEEVMDPSPIPTFAPFNVLIPSQRSTAVCEEQLKKDTHNLPSKEQILSQSDDYKPQVAPSFSSAIKETQMSETSISTFHSKTESEQSLDEIWETPVSETVLATEKETSAEELLLQERSENTATQIIVESEIAVDKQESAETILVDTHVTVEPQITQTKDENISIPVEQIESPAADTKYEQEVVATSLTRSLLSNEANKVSDVTDHVFTSLQSKAVDDVAEPVTTSASLSLIEVTKVDDVVQDVVTSLPSKENIKVDDVTEAIDTPLPLPVASDDVTNTNDVSKSIHFNSNTEINVLKMESPRLDPTFILSPPTTRSKIKPNAPKSALKKSTSATPSTKKIHFDLPKFDYEDSPPRFVFSPPSVVRTRSQRKRKLDPATDTSVAKSPRTPKTSVASTSGKTPTRSSKRLTAKKDDNKQIRKSPRKSPETKKMVAKSPDALKTPKKSSRATKTPSKSPEKMQSVSRLRTPKKKTEDLLSPQRSARKGRPKSASTEDTDSSQMDVSPVVTRTASRSKSATRSRSRVKKSKSDSSVAPSPSARMPSPSPTSPVSVRTSPRRNKGVSRKYSDDDADTTVVAKASVSRRSTRTSSVSSDDVPAIPKTPSRRKHSKDEAEERPPTIAKSSSRGKRTSAPGNEQPSVTRSSSRGKGMSSSENDEPSVTRSSSHGRKMSAPGNDKPSVTKSSSHGKRSATGNSQPSVTRSSSRGKSMFAPGNDGPSVTKSSSRGKSTTAPENDDPSLTRSSSHEKRTTAPGNDEPSVIRSSSRGKRTTAPGTDEPSLTLSSSHEKRTTAPGNNEPSVIRSSSRGKRTTAPGNDEPSVIRSSSRGKRTTAPGNDKPSVTRSSSHEKRTTAPGNDEPSVTTTRTRSGSKTRSSVTASRERKSSVAELHEIIEEADVSILLPNQTTRKQTKQRRIFEKSDKDFSKDPRCPVNQPVRLIELSPESSRQQITTEVVTTTTRTTRSGKVIFPVTSRRTAKVFVWSKQERTYRKK